VTAGAWLGLALAIYLGSVISHFDLRWFYPVWIGLSLLLGIIWSVRKSSPLKDVSDPQHDQLWMLLVLFLVAISRLSIALPDTLPMGIDPPDFFLILARKLQITHHAITDWQPFESIPVNYPAGAPTLIAILSTLCGLPVHTVFKDFLPLLGVLGTAQVYAFTRRVAGNGAAGLYAAMAYGLWAGLGSIDFYKWGGMPNEIAILLLLAALSAWVSDGTALVRMSATSVLLAAMILSHHHTQIAATGVIATIAGWMLIRGRDRLGAGLLILSVLAAFLLDGFFLISYLPKIGILKHTGALFSEWPMYLRVLIPYMGLVFVAASAAGAALCLARLWPSCHPTMPCACAALIVMYAVFEYLPPPGAPPPGRRHWLMFTPSHFLNDLPCFIAGFAGIAVATIQMQLRLSRTIVFAAMLLLGGSIYDVWKDQIGGSGIQSDYLAACDWIRLNTSSDSIVRGDTWARYLSWRCGEQFNLPNSETSDSPERKLEHVAQVLAGKAPPDSPQMKEVEIVKAGDESGRPVLWKSSAGLIVVQDWPN
jgi:hypothetical protein